MAKIAQFALFSALRLSYLSLTANRQVRQELAQNIYSRMFWHVAVFFAGCRQICQYVFSIEQGHGWPRYCLEL